MPPDLPETFCELIGSELFSDSYFCGAGAAGAGAGCAVGASGTVPVAGGAGRWPTVAGGLVWSVATSVRSVPKAKINTNAAMAAPAIQPQVEVDQGAVPAGSFKSLMRA